MFCVLFVVERLESFKIFDLMESAFDPFAQLSYSAYNDRVFFHGRTNILRLVAQLLRATPAFRFDQPARQVLRSVAQSKQEHWLLFWPVLVAVAFH
jgi:hypothetical protein